MADTTSATKSSLRSKKVLVPKVWKRPHSTIYGKNVEFGSSLYSDKIGELNGRKFNSELPWSVRNSGGSSATSSAGGGGAAYSQGYLSNLLLEPRDLATGKQPTDYAQLLACTNPRRSMNHIGGDKKRVDFYEQYMDFGRELDRLSGSSLLRCEPMISRQLFNQLVDFDYELGIFLPNSGSQSRGFTPVSLLHALPAKPGVSTSNSSSSNSHWTPTAPTIANYRSTNTTTTHPINATCDHGHDYQRPLPIINLLTRNTNLLPKHKCRLADSPYGQSADGRKLSLSSINPHSYRPSVASKTTTTHASDGEEIDLVDRSSPFYTDRWAGKTIRHFDSDLYSNANLFKSMIL